MHLNRQNSRRSGTACKHFALLALAFCVLLGAERVAGQAPESDVKAAFIFNFLKFIDWPTTAFESPAEPFIIGVVGADPIAQSLERAVAGKVVKNREVEVRILKSAREAERVHIVFLSNSERGRLTQELKFLAGKPILTVSDMPRFAEDGGMIQFYKTADERVRLLVNMQPVEASGVKISSNLLRLCDFVNEGGRSSR